MTILDLGNPTSMKDAGDALLERLDLNNVQISDYNNFIRNVMPRYLSQPIIDDKFTLTFSGWYLDDSSLYSPDICKSDGHSREVTLRATAHLRMKELRISKEEKFPHNSEIIFPIEITKIPLLSDTGSFLIKGVNRVMVSHLEKSNTVIKSKIKGAKDLTFSTTQASFKLSLVDGIPKCKINLGNNLALLKTTRSRRGRYSTIRLSGLLKSLNMESAEQIKKVIGTNPYLHGIEEKPAKVDDYMADIGQIRLSISERSLLNRKLSFRTRLSNQILAEDVECEDLRLKKGAKVTPEQATTLQQNGIQNVLIKIPGGVINVWNNGFVDPSKYIEPNDICETMKEWETKEETGEQIKQIGYYEINKNKLDLLKGECNRHSLELKQHLELHQQALLGATLNEDDIIAMINLFSFYLMDLEEVDDRDSLNNKSLVNISTVFETILSNRLYVPKDGVRRSLVTTLLHNISQYELSGRQAGNELKIANLNCPESETISSVLINDPWNKLFQVESNINPLDEINHKRKISLIEVDGRGGVSAKFSDPRPRSVNPSHIGRICPIESPEGENIGLVVHLASLARVNGNGVIEAPFFKVDKEKQEIQFDKAIYMDYGEEVLYTRAIVPRISDKTFAKVSIMRKGIELASYDLEPAYGLKGNRIELLNKTTLEKTAKSLFSKHKDADSYNLTYARKDWFIDEIIDGIEGNGHPVKCRWEDIDYVTCRGEHILSVVTGNIPFAEYNDGTRLMMGAAMSKQTEAVIGSEPPLVKTPLTNKIGTETSGVILAPYDCEVQFADSTRVVIVSIDGKKKDNIALESALVTSEKTMQFNRLKVKPGDVLMKGDLIADIDSTEEGILQIGTNLTVAYVPWLGYNYEDAIIISERLLREDVLTSYRATEYDFNFNSIDNLRLEDAQDRTSFKKFTEVADSRGIITVGTKVKRDDVLAVKRDKLNPDRTTVVQHTNNSDGIVVRVDEVKGTKKEITKYTIVVATKEKIAIGDKLAGRHGNKGVISRILPVWKMPRLADGTIIDILLTPLGIPSRMNIGQLLESQLGLILREAGFNVTYDARNKVDVPKIKAITNEWTGDSEGKLQLYDGVTGEPLMMKSNVGVTTIHKLRHLSGKKMYARGVGKPSDYTQEGQPTQGKKRGGGQKIDEMTVWSLQAHGAAHCLKELQTYKSDDPENRTQWRKYLREEVSITGTSNVPRSYKMSALELMSCGIDLRHLNEKGEEINIFEDWVKNGKVTQPTLVKREGDHELSLEKEMKLKIEDKKIQKEKEMHDESMSLIHDLLDDMGIGGTEEVDLDSILDDDDDPISHEVVKSSKVGDIINKMSEEEREKLFLGSPNDNDEEEDDDDYLPDFPEEELQTDEEFNDLHTLAPMTDKEDYDPFNNEEFHSNEESLDDNQDWGLDLEIGLELDEEGNPIETEGDIVYEDEDENIRDFTEMGQIEDEEDLDGEIDY